MLKRAGISMLVALVAAFFGFTGLLQTTAVFAQDVFYILSAFALLSLMFSLFEPAPDTRSNPLHLASHRTEL